MSWDFEAATLLKTGVQVFQYWYEETNAILNLQPQQEEISGPARSPRPRTLAPYFRSNKENLEKI